MRFAHIVFAVVLVPLAACSNGKFSATTAAPAAVPDPTLTFYNAYGDSITFGSGVPDPAQDYVSLVGAYNSLPTVDYGIGGLRTCALASNELQLIYPTPPSAARGLSTLLIGTNDVDTIGSGAYEATFNLCQQALISWLAVPYTSKLLAVDPSVTTTGATHIESGLWNSVVTDALGATATFPISTPAAGPIYVWYQIIDADLGTFTVTLDGKILGSYITAAPTAVEAPYPGANSMALLRLPGIPAGSHTLTFTQTSTAPYGLGVMAIGAPPITPKTRTSRVLVGTVPPQLLGQNATIVAAYNADIQANVSLLQSDGLNITLFNTGKYMTATTTDLTDALHPNALGYQEIFKAIEDALSS